VSINSTIKEQTLNLTILISLFALETGRMRTQARKKKKTNIGEHGWNIHRTDLWRKWNYSSVNDFEIFTLTTKRLILISENIRDIINPSTLQFERKLQFEIDRLYRRARDI